MTKRDLAKLQRLINQAASTANTAKTAYDALMNWCVVKYGYEPGDIDADFILDSLGSCGVADGIDATQFDEIMSAGG